MGFFTLAMFVLYLAFISPASATRFLLAVRARIGTINRKGSAHARTLAAAHARRPAGPHAAQPNK